MRILRSVRPVLSAAQLKVVLATVALAFAFVAIHPMLARAEMRIQEVKSPAGITAWLVEDYSVPIVSMRFAFRGGSVQDPKGKAGLSYLMSGLFDEGAGDLDREAYQDRLDDSGAEISFNAGSDEIFGSFRAIDEDLDEGLALLAKAVQAPRFDPEPLERVRSQILTGIEAGSRDPEQQSSRKWAEALYGQHPYARPTEGTAESVKTLTREDLSALHRALFARDNLVVSVVGAIDAETLKRHLDGVFAPLPEKASLRDVPRVVPKLEQELSVAYDLPQTSIRLAYPGIERKDPAFFAAYLMNEVLGGGTFSSRLFEEVREKRGLTYGIGSSLSTRRYSSALAIATSTRSDRVGETLEIIRNEVRRMAEEGPTQKELEAAKRYTIGAYAINNLDSSGSIASTLTQLQLEELGIDYIDRRGPLIDAVTIEQVREQAQRLLTTKPAVMLVGPEQAGEPAGPAAVETPAKPETNTGG